MLTIPAPARLHLPFTEWRGGQRYAIRSGLSGDTPFVVLQCPTGFGKTGVAGGLAQLSNDRHVILTATKHLQDVYNTLFPFVYDMRGQSNYECLAARDEFKKWFSRRSWVGCDEGPCHSDIPCTLKDNGCSYYDAWREMLRARVVVTSYAMWLATRLHARGMGTAPTLVCDEAHSLADQLMKTARIEIPKSALDSRPPRSIRAWSAWASAKYTDLRRTTENVEVKLRRRPLADTCSRLSSVDPATWVWEEGPEKYTFEPIVPDQLLGLLVGSAQQRVIFLSATITPDVLHVIGVKKRDMRFIVFPSTFPIETSPIYVVKTARVDHRTFREFPEDEQYWLNTIDAIIEDRLDRKGIIHAVSYGRARAILRGSRFRRHFIYHRPGELTDAWDVFTRADAPAVFISPAADTGLDAAYDIAEYQILVKIPFPDTRSKITAARVEAIPNYRTQVAAQRIAQAAGRINRAEDDSGETFIIDDHFRWFYREATDYLPDNFHERLVWRKTLPSPLPKLRRKVA